MMRGSSRWPCSALSTLGVGVRVRVRVRDRVRAVQRLEHVRG